MIGAGATSVHVHEHLFLLSLAIEMKTEKREFLNFIDDKKRSQTALIEEDVRETQLKISKLEKRQVES